MLSSSSLDRNYFGLLETVVKNKTKNIAVTLIMGEAGIIFI